MCDIYEYAGMELIATTESTFEPSNSTETTQLTDNTYRYIPSGQEQTLTFPEDGGSLNVMANSISLLWPFKRAVQIDDLMINFQVLADTTSTTTSATTAASTAA